MMRALTLIVLAISVLCLSACGQKGRLYLPEKPAATPTTSAPAPATSS